jgi:hypothetical protein
VRSDVRCQQPFYPPSDMRQLESNRNTDGRALRRIRLNHLLKAPPSAAKTVAANKVLRRERGGHEAFHEVLVWLEGHADWRTPGPNFETEPSRTQTCARRSPHSIMRADCHCIFADEAYSTLVGGGRRPSPRPGLTKRTIRLRIRPDQLDASCPSTPSSKTPHMGRVGSRVMFSFS